MEMDSWQYWQAIEENVKKGKVGLFCTKCNKKYNYKEREYTFKPCEKCKGEVRFRKI